MEEVIEFLKEQYNQFNRLAISFNNNNPEFIGISGYEEMANSYKEAIEILEDSLLKQRNKMKKENNND